MMLWPEARALVSRQSAAASCEVVSVSSYHLVPVHEILFTPAQAPKADGSLQSLVHDAVNDPSTQAAFAHVMEAAATETKALTQLSGPATAPAPGVSHPFDPTS